ncbi:MAG TPA: ABC transporter substrate-binding protein [Propionibacteriaceae bacterium]
MRPKSLVVGLAATVALSLATACSSSEPDSSQAAPSSTTASARQSDPPKNLDGKVRIGIAAPVAQLILPFLADEQGDFKKHGLSNVEVSFVPGPQLIPAAAGGAVDVAISAAPSTELSALNGGALKIVGAWDKSALQFLVARNGIKSPEELKGKRVGVNGSKAGSSTILMNYALRKAGLKIEDVNIIALQDHGAQLQAYIGGQLDAMITSPPSLQRAQAAQPDTQVIRNFDDLFFPENEIIVNTKWSDNNPDQVVAVLAGLQDALQTWRTKPDLAKTLIAEKLKLDPAKDSELVNVLYENTMKIFLQNIEPLTEDETRKIFALLRDSGFPEAVDEKASTVIDGSYLEKALKK